jgi:hypothetical protein
VFHFVHSIRRTVTRSARTVAVTTHE